MRRISSFSACVILGLVIVALSALVPVEVGSQAKSGEGTDEMALAVADAQKDNLTALKKYTWQVKTDLSMNGESKATSINQMSFDADGKIQSTHMGGESSVEQKRGLRGRREDKKIEDFTEYLEAVLQQSFNYVFMSKGTLVDLFDRAKITNGKDTVQIDASDLFMKGDAVSMTVDPSSHFVQTLSFKTTYKEDAVQGTVKFSPIENGPNRPAGFDLEIPSRSIKVSSETSNWVAQN